MEKQSELIYEPYTGGGSPTRDQADNNTLYLAKMLKDAGIPYKEDRAYAMEMWSGDELNLRFTLSTGEEAVVGYDRWGFCVDLVDCDIDQSSLEETFAYIQANV